MIRDITLGQYYGVESPIHRLDPRIKIIATILFIVELFLVDSKNSIAHIVTASSVIGTVVLLRFFSFTILSFVCVFVVFFFVFGFSVTLLLTVG